MKKNNCYIRLWKHILPKRRKQIAFLLLIAVFASFAEVLSIGAVLPFLAILVAPERLLENTYMQSILGMLDIKEAGQLLFPLTAVFIFAALFSGYMRVALLWTQARLGFSIGADISINMYENTLYQSYQVHTARNSSQVISAISTKTNMVINYTLLPLIFMVSSSLILISLMTVLIVIDPFIALTGFFGFALIYVLIIFLTKKQIEIDSQRVSHESNRVIKALQEGLGGIRDVLIDGTQATYCKIYKEADVVLRKSQANIQIISGIPRHLIEAIGIVLIAVTAYFLADREAGISNIVPVLGALAIGAQRLLPILQQIYSSWTNIRGGQVSLQDVLALLEQPRQSNASEAALQQISFNSKIEFNKVSFRYSEDAPFVLENVNFVIPKGYIVGFVGTTGSGKSTLLDLIMGLLQPTEGEVRVDDVPIKINNHRAWQQHIAHVPQSIFLADATVAENIAFGVSLEKINLEKMRKAAIKAQISETVESWSHQYYSLVGERGIRLSGGQRQRIGIARALYKEADVIVFDEATSALDNNTEFAVMEAIENIGMDVTVLMVAHRLTTLKNCDLIFEVSEGRVKLIENT